VRIAITYLPEIIVSWTSCPWRGAGGPVRPNDETFVMVLGLLCAAAIVASLLVTPVVVRVANRWRLYDLPGAGRRIHSRAVPRLGGVAVFAATLCGLGVAASGWLGPLLDVRDTTVFALIAGGGIMFLVGLWDDLRGLSPATKLLAQCVAAATVFRLGFRIELLSLGAGSELHLGWLALPLTMAWIVAVTNAFNLIDGLDGLAAGIAVVALVTTFMVSLALGNGEVAIICAVLVGALLGFLRFNFNPARIFLGDSGSLFIGFTLAMLSVHGSMKSATAVLVLVPLFALALPLLDTTLTIGRRWLRGVPLSVADSQHIHHKLLAHGLTQRRVVLVLYVAATALAVFGVSLAFAPPAGVIVIALGGGAASLVVLLIGMHRLEYHEFLDAGAVLASGAGRIRRLIRDQILAREAAEAIVVATSLMEVTGILRRSAEHFGFLALELCRESSSCARQISAMVGTAERPWKLDYPVAPRHSVEDDPYVLRIWCDSGGANRPYGAERVARILGPPLESWLMAWEVGTVKGRQGVFDGSFAISAATQRGSPGASGASTAGVGEGRTAAEEPLRQPRLA
jgi:UDP-GlcNAc:undecaprenyl-phosphate/decaprenyl-phosphate GlcNAc-1-phosphate transferase